MVTPTVTDTQAPINAVFLLKRAAAPAGMRRRKALRKPKIKNSAPTGTDIALATKRSYTGPATKRTAKRSRGSADSAAAAVLQGRVSAPTQVRAPATLKGVRRAQRKLSSTRPLGQRKR